MKKTCSLFLAFFAINLAFAQENVPAKSTPECLKVAEFNKKIAPIKQADKIYKAEIIHVRGKRPVRHINLSAETIKSFDVYKWLAPDTTNIALNGEMGPVNAIGTDRLYMEYYYVKGGQVKYGDDNISFCEFKTVNKPTRPTLKLKEKTGDGKSCFQVSDFKSKLQGMPEIDSIDVSYTLINTAGERTYTSFKTLKEVKQFNLYNWLSKGAEVTSTIGGDETNSTSAEGKKINAQPGDLVIVNLSYKKAGKEVYERNQFPICPAKAKK